MSRGVDHPESHSERIYKPREGGEGGRRKTHKHCSVALFSLSFFPFFWVFLLLDGISRRVFAPVSPSACTRTAESTELETRAHDLGARLHHHE